MLFEFVNYCVITALCFSFASSNVEEVSATAKRSGAEITQSSMPKTSLRDFTPEQLRTFNGTNESPVYVSFLGKVLDVSVSDEFRTGGPFYHYAGREAADVENAAGSASLFYHHYCKNELDSCATGCATCASQDSLSWVLQHFESDKKYPFVGRVSVPESEREFTFEALAEKTGRQEDLLPNRIHPEILICVNHKVFDVSYGGYGFYAPGMAYHAFAGKDASKALARMSFDSDLFGEICDLSQLNEKEIAAVKRWEEMYVAKYPIVGTCV